MKPRLHPDAAGFLQRSGLLFQINREHLHPVGLALAVEVEEDNNDGPTGPTFTCSILDYREDPEGVVFPPEDLESGARRIASFFRENQDRIARRRAAMGHVAQPLPIAVSSAPQENDPPETRITLPSAKPRWRPDLVRVVIAVAVIVDLICILFGASARGCF